MRIYEAKTQGGFDLTIRALVNPRSSSHREAPEVHLKVAIGPRGLPHPQDFHDPVEEGVHEFTKLVTAGEDLRLVIEP